MKRTLTEQKVLQRLNIDDFRHLTKDKVIMMASMLDKMDPEVAKKAIEQFPEFAKTMTEILSEQKKALGDVVEANERSVKSVYDSADDIISSLQDELKKDDLSFDEKKYIIQTMMELQNMKQQKDSENKRFLAVIAACATVAVGIATVGLQVALGGKADINMDDIKKLGK